MITLNEYLQNKSYPGRGIFIGKNEEYLVAAYFIMGRSENSRNRVFTKTDLGIKTMAFDESKLVDPSLIIYNPVIKFNDNLIITNGDQTDTIYEFLKKDRGFNCALKTREFEPDAPNFTPRISALISKDYSFKMNILKSDEGDSNHCLRYFYEYNNIPVNTGRIIHTYFDDGNPIPSFIGEPVKVSFDGDVKAFSNNLWDSLNEENKVSLYVNFINMKTNEYTVEILNKNV